MWPFRRAGDQDESVAVAEAPVEESLDELRAQIDALSRQNRQAPSLEFERQLRDLRHRAGIRVIEHPGGPPQFASPDATHLPDGALCALWPSDLTPELLRAAVLRDGGALVRELIPRDDALRLAAGIDRAYRERAAATPDPSYYDEFQPDERFGPVMWRAWIQEGGGLLAADSPGLLFELTERFEQAGIPALVSGYLGEPGLLSVHKTTLRRADPSVSGQWHQDGKFMGPVRSLNLWLSLSQCGRDAPGLDLVPRRLEDYVATGTDGAALDWTISDLEASQAASDTGIVRPLFEPGDAMLFDELFLHRTASEATMARQRFAVESWFFGGSAFPADYAPLAV
jgi:hypothetical protein